LNKNLGSTVDFLHNYTVTKFPNKHFTFGDVISLAGKVAVETAYPCMQIAWSYGRTTCTDKNFPPSAPKGSFSTIADFQPFLDNYGLSAYELAVLTAGSHGIATAAATVSNSGFGNFNFANVNSGQKWILNSFKLAWSLVESTHSLAQYVATGGGDTLMRLQSDLVFFPAIVSRAGGVPDPAAHPVQQQLKAFALQNRTAFDTEFATVYAKMLEIGVDPSKLTALVEPATQGVCGDHFPVTQFQAEYEYEEYELTKAPSTSPTVTTHQPTMSTSKAGLVTGSVVGGVLGFGVVGLAGASLFARHARKKPAANSSV